MSDDQLFKVGENVNGSYVYPTTDLPDLNRVRGDEISHEKATALCGSLNLAVNTYVCSKSEVIEGLARSREALWGILNAIDAWAGCDDGKKGLETFITAEMRQSAERAVLYWPSI